MMTVLPVKNRSRAQTMRPALGDSIGVPAGLRKSAPPCGLRRSPLNTLRVPKLLFDWPGTGRTNGADHNRVAAELAYASLRNVASRRMRASSAGDGLTKLGSTW